MSSQTWETTGDVYYIELQLIEGTLAEQEESHVIHVVAYSAEAAIAIAKDWLRDTIARHEADVVELRRISEWAICDKAVP